MDILASSQWQALRRESGLASSLISAGATALGRANYADRMGDYYVAFFGLANGIERLAKLVWVTDHVLTTGISPTDKQLKALGHDVRLLVDEVHQISTRRSMSLHYTKPTNSIADHVIDTLDYFSDARRGRYANFSLLGLSATGDDPMKHWWLQVVEPILDAHFRGSRREISVTADASMVSHLIESHAITQHINETGGALSTVYDASIRTGENEVAQKYGRFYSLVTVRWMSDVFRVLTGHISPDDPSPWLYGHYEHFDTFLAPDKYLLTRKTWPLS